MGDFREMLQTEVTKARQALLEEELKSNKIKDLKEELIQLQMEQTKIMPELPKDLLASLPTELSDELQKSMKEAYLKMATEKMDETILQSETLESQNKFEESKEKINSHITKSHQISTSNELLTTSIPEELLTSLP